MSRTTGIAALKAAGFADAARLLEALPGGVPAQQQAAPQEQQEAPQRPLTPSEAHDAQLRAQGEALLEQMRAQTSFGRSIDGGSMLGGDR